MLTREIAERIVLETMERLARNINMMDTDGRIIASGDRTRIGTLHVGAREAIATQEAVCIAQSALAEWPGAQAGINMPIFFQGQTVGVVGISGDPQQLLEVAQLVRMTAELMLRQAYLTSQQQWRIRLQELVLEEVLRPSPSPSPISSQSSGASHTPARIGELLRMLGIEPRPPFGVGLIRLEEAPGYHSLLLRKIEEQYGGSGVLVGLRDERHLVLVALSMPWTQAVQHLEEICQMLARNGQGYRAGYSGTAEQLVHMPQLLDEARMAMSCAVPSGEARGFAGLEPSWLLHQAEASQRQRFVQRLLAPLDETLRETLRSFLRCDLHIAQTAADLYVHKNTVIYRLRKIREATGCDPQRFHEALRLQAALWCEEAER